MKTLQSLNEQIAADRNIAPSFTRYFARREPCAYCNGNGMVLAGACCGQKCTFCAGRGYIVQEPQQ